MSDSIWNDPRITAFALGELPEDERTAFERELESNPALAAAVAEATSVTGQLKELYAGETTGPLDDERRRTIVGPAGPLQSAAAAQAPKRSWKVPALVLATAASLLLLLALPPIQQAREASPRLSGLNDQELDASETAVEQRVSESSDEPGRFAEQTAPQAFKNAVEAPAQAVEQRADEIVLPDSGQIPNRPAVAPSARRARSVLLESLRSDDQDDAASIASSEPAREAAATDRQEEVSATIGFDGVSGLPQPQPAQLGVEQRVAGRGTGAIATVPGVQVSNEDFEAVPPHGVATTQEKKTTRGLAFEFAPGRDVVLGKNPVVPADEGTGPGQGGDKYDPITDNPFKRVAEHPVSTFSVDVDTASYSKTRDFLMRANRLPRPDAVRIEELVNYFDYDYTAPAADAQHPFSAHTVVTSCPWNAEHRLARIALKGKLVEPDERPRCNLVFLLDTSGSMNESNKLPLVIDGMKMLLKQLDDEDRVAIAVYAGSAGLVLDSTPAAQKRKIRRALTQLHAGGSTNGGAGIALAYQTARDHFITAGVNRVILCTDGDFNVGTTGTDALVRMVAQEAKGNIFLSVLGFGMGNHNDAMLEQISGRGNGNYAFIDNENEARKVLVDQTNATLVTIAKDVKLQIEFNPQQVSAYRLIGYENRLLAKEDFNDDNQDAGEIGAGHAVTALYEIVPAGVQADASGPAVDDLKYQSKPQPTDAADSDEMMTLKLRYKQPTGDRSTLIEFPVQDDGIPFGEADQDVRFAAAVAGFGMQLRRSDYKGSWTLSDVRRVAESARGEDRHGLRGEFIDLIDKAGNLMGEE